MVASHWRRRYPVFTFLALFAVFMGLLAAFALLTPFCDRYFPHYLALSARLSGHILNFFSQDVTVRDASILSPAFSITVKRGCDAIEPTALFICAILAFPSPVSRKIAGIVAGTLFLAILNILRIVTLFMVGAYLPRAFNMMHFDVWQGLFIFLAILLWMVWLLWTARKPVLRQKPPG
jgi:exosortase/archaeosortase family protein